METIGTIQKVLPLETGTGKTGNEWKRQVIVISHGEGQYVKELALTLVNKSIEQNAQFLVVGMQARFHIDARSQEWNGRYYTECTAWKIEPLQAQQPQFPPQSQYGQPQPQYTQPQQPQQPAFGQQFGQFGQQPQQYGAPF